LADPICPALAAAAEDVTDPTQPLPLLDPSQPLAQINPSDLPQCPKCEEGLLRPDVVWFGENLNDTMLEEIDRWIADGPVAMMLVIGTSAKVWPAAGYIHKASKAGASVVTVNPEAELDEEMYKLHPGDFAFGQDAAQLLPILLEPIIGKMKEDGTFD
jgi:NAD+-dependent protein deacetylase sirtuin 5